MNSTAALLVSSVSIGFGAVAAYFALQGGTAPPAPAAPVVLGNGGGGIDAAEAAAIREELAGLRAELGLLGGGGNRVAAAVDDEAIARAVAAYFEGLEAEPEADAPGEEAVLGSPAEIAALLADADQVTSTELWARLVAEGRDKEVLDHLKALAEANPNDIDVQLDLANAYLGRTQQSAGPMAGLYATLADQTLDRALEVNPDHWEARFTKAVALSFWPPNLGKQPEAIRQFETLIDQQGRSNPRPQHAQTHFMLGNLYQQNGQPEKALEVWRQGLSMFPDDAQLMAQVQLMEGR